MKYLIVSSKGDHLSRNFILILRIFKYLRSLMNHRIVMYPKSCSSIPKHSSEVFYQTICACFLNDLNLYLTNIRTKCTIKYK